ncbi:unnamed protein product [Amaranthus hypochondriacus]
MFRLEQACNLPHQNSRPQIASSVANSVSQVSKGMFRSEQAWNLAQQDSRPQRTSTVANLIQDFKHGPRQLQWIMWLKLGIF